MRVIGDATRLEQVLRNLLQNALKYAADSDRVDVRIRRVHEQKAAEMAEMEVQDYGPGISKAEQPYIFTPFYQVPTAETARHEGLGLGLYAVSNWCRHMTARLRCAHLKGVAPSLRSVFRWPRKTRRHCYRQRARGPRCHRSTTRLAEKKSNAGSVPPVRCVTRHLSCESRCIQSQTQERS